MIGGAGLSGGIGSSISGGSFWKGFGVGATVGAVNHAMHEGLFGGADPIEKINMSQASDQEIIDQFAYALKMASIRFALTGQYEPINLMDYFTGIPRQRGKHLIVNGELCGIRVELEIPLQETKGLNWGGYGYRSVSQNNGERWVFFQYTKFNTVRYPLWGIGFPARFESTIRNTIPGL